MKIKKSHKPNKIDKLYTKGKSLFFAKKFDSALKVAKELQRLDPNYRNAYYLEGAIWHDLDKPLQQYRALKKILPFLDTSSPADADFNAEIYAKIAAAADKLAMPAESYKFRMEFAKVAKTLFDGSHGADYKREYIKAIDGAIFATYYLENFSPEDFQVLYDMYNEHLADVVPYPREFHTHDRIHIGFVSADFIRHPMINWASVLFTGLNKKLFAVHYYSNVKEPDVITEALRSKAEFWRDIRNLTDEEAAKLIHDDEIDILFDLSGHTAGNRLDIAAYRPAPVQMWGVGAMNSSGMNCFDYFLSDIYCTQDVATVSNYFDEKVIRLPHSHICYRPTIKIEPAVTPPCLANGYITFGSFNNLRKANPLVLRTWKKILDAVPNSRLLLKNKIMGDDDVKNFIGERLESFGFDLAHVELRGASPNYLEEYGDMDIALDTFPYTGGVTTCDALYMGVPVVSLYGDRLGSRFGYSILKNIGLDELVVDNYDDYVNRAIALANDWELLTVLRKNLRTMMQKSPLMDTKNYIRIIQQTFISILSTERNN